MEKTENGKVKVVGVRFRTAGKIYYFDPGDFELSRGSHVIVETARGIEYGFVVGPPMEVEEKLITQPLKAVLRISTEEDDRREQKNREREREAFWICRERIQKRGLEMKLIDAEYTFDNSKVLFYFTADGRVDFRELVKDLAGVFRTRIELRQVGVRDETKILGGYGSCGRPLCCHTWLSDFVPVSIKMAKEQNLSLNPGKISGVCGRLMCCLKNEAETYEELNKTLPHAGDEVEASDGMNGLVESVNILRQTARIIVEVDDEKELHEYSVSDLTILRRRKRGTSRPTMQKNTPPQKPASAKETREPREGEVDGREYFFKTVAQVKDMIFRGELLEYAQVYGNYYGTPKPYVMNLLNEGKDVLLEIDIQGALQIKKVFPDGVFVFVMPPSLEELRARLYKRGKDTEEVIEKRLKAAAGELKSSSGYDYIVVNDVAEEATQCVLTLLEAERYRAKRNGYLIDKILGQNA